MKKVIIIASTIIALLSTATFAHSKFRGHHGEPFGKIEHILKKLDVTTEQREKIEPIVETTKTELKPIMEQSRETRKAIKELVHGDEIDKAALAELAQQKADLMVQKIELMASAKSQISSVLTPEQLEKFESMKEKYKSKRHKRCGEKGKWTDSIE